MAVFLLGGLWHPSPAADREDVTQRHKQGLAQKRASMLPKRDPAFAFNVRRAIPQIEPNKIILFHLFGPYGRHRTKNL